MILLEGHDGNMICEDITEHQPVEEKSRRDAAKVSKPKIEPKITLHTLIGLTTLITMSMTAKIGSLDVTVLINSGSTQLHQLSLVKHVEIICDPNTNIYCSSGLWQEAKVSRAF